MESLGAFMVIQALFSGIAQNVVISKISRLSYGIYLMHIFLLGASYSLISGMFPTPVTILLTGVSTFVACCLLTWAISAVPYGKYIIG